VAGDARLRLLSTACELAALAGYLAAADEVPSVRVGELLGTLRGCGRRRGAAVYWMKGASLTQ
jgi:hypothetical protein